MNDSPILFLVFNRPTQTADTFSEIRRSRPSKLFIAADGPRSNRAEEFEQCRKVREICSQVDWSCAVQTLYRESNLGCEVAVGGAITWFFEQVESGIILEDDCVPSASFFPFCHELLSMYREDSRVGCITGNNFQRGRRFGGDSYYFSKHFHCWGWATWRRAWQHYNSAIAPPAGKSDRDVIESFNTIPNETDKWLQIFKTLREGTLNTWDYRWLYSLWQNDWVTLTPQVNLVKNIGFGAEATHTTKGTFHTPDACDIEFPLRHPESVTANEIADAFVTRAQFGLGITARIRSALGRTLRATFR